MKHSSQVALAVSACILVSSATLAADLVVYDGFGGGTMADINGYGGGTGWTGAWTDITGVLPTGIGTGLTFPGLPSTAGGAVTPPSPNLMDATEYVRSFPPVAGDHMYVSFLYQPTNNYGSYGGIQFGTYPAQVFIGSPLGYYLYGFRVGRYGFTLSNVPETPGVTVFIVVEVQTQPATNQTAYHMFIDPTPGGPRPTYSNVDAVVAGSVLPSMLTLLNDGGVTTDEIRIGTTWASVTSAPPCPGDLNADGQVNLADLATLLSHFGTLSGATPAQGDTDNDSDVDLVDLAQLLANFGATC